MAEVAAVEVGGGVVVAALGAVAVDSSAEAIQGSCVDCVPCAAPVDCVGCAV